MSYKRADKSFSKNVELVAYHDMDDKAGFQMAMQIVKGRYYLYIAIWGGANGWQIFDVTEPSKPKLVKFIPEPGGKQGTSTHKIEIADSIMIAGIQQKPEMIFGTLPTIPYDEGILIYDVKDPENPRFLSHWKTGSLGVHWNYYDGGRYVHLSANCPGFSGNIYRIIDINEPTKPVEVGRWWVPEQWLDGGNPPPKDRLMVHGPPYVKGNKAYISWTGIGMVILDISDITRPKFAGKLQYHPPFGGGISSHTVMPLSKRDLAIVTSEGTRVCSSSKESLKIRFQGRTPPINLFGIADISDPTNPSLISVFPYPEVPEGYPEKNFSEIEGLGAFGLGVHNIHQPQNSPALEDRNDRIYAAYFNAGVRVYDINDPFMPKEIAYYLAPDPKKWIWNRECGAAPFPGPNRDLAEHILVDKRGYIYVNHMQQGLSILRCTV
jgi:hypothetical protein